MDNSSSPFLQNPSGMGLGGKKVIIIGPAHPLRGGGITTFNERLARQFNKEGNHAVIYSFSLQYPGFLFPGKSQFTDEPAPKDLEIHSRINSVNPFNWLRVGNEIKNLKPDIVVVRYWIPLMGPCLGTILRIIKKINTQGSFVLQIILYHTKSVLATNPLPVIL